MRISVVVAVLILLGAATWLFIGSTANEQGLLASKTPAATATIETVNTDDSSADKPGERAGGPEDRNESKPFSVAVLRSQEEPFQRVIALTGRSKEFRRVQLRTEISGRIERLEVERGSRVGAGSLLIRISDEDRLVRLESARAREAQARRNMEATEQVGSKGYASESEMLAARTALLNAQQALFEAEKAVDDLEIRAPFGATVLDSFVELGSFVRSGEPVLELIDTDPLLVVVGVAEFELNAVHKNLDVPIEMANGVATTGEVSFISPVANAKTQTFPTEIRIANPEGRIPAGMSARVMISLAPRKSHKVPYSALTIGNDGDVVVKVVDDRNVVRERSITIIGDREGYAWIVGLAPKETIIVSGQDFVLPEQTVTPVEAGASPSGDPLTGNPLARR